LDFWRFPRVLCPRMSVDREMVPVEHAYWAPKQLILNANIQREIPAPTMEAIHCSERVDVPGQKQFLSRYSPSKSTAFRPQRLPFLEDTRTSFRESAKEIELLLFRYQLMERGADSLLRAR